MPEGLSAIEVGKEVHEHGSRGGPPDANRREGRDGSDQQDRRRRHQLISITEAVLLSIVTITAAWSGYAAAKWSTKSALDLSDASTLRDQATRAYQQSLTLRAQDQSNFNAWFAAYLSGSKAHERVAEKRFRPEYEVAFRAWLATKPFSNPKAPKGPSYMPQYQPTGYAESFVLDAQASSKTAEAEHAASTSDEYIRVTVILASVLFLVGLSSHFPLHAIRLGLIAVGAGMLVFAAVEILKLPSPPA